MLSPTANKTPSPATQTGTVYVLRWPSGDAGYVGSTIGKLRKRLVAHLSAARTGVRTVLYDYVREHMAEGEEPEILAVAEGVPEASLKATEDNYIAALRGIAGFAVLNRYGAAERTLVGGSAAKKRPDRAGIGTTICPIRCITTGEIFPSQHAAARELGLVQENISQAIKRNGTTGGLKFERVAA